LLNLKFSHVLVASAYTMQKLNLIDSSMTGHTLKKFF